MTHLGTNGALSRSSNVRSSPLSILIAEDGGVPRQLAGVRPGIRVQQQLVGVEPVTRLRLVRAVDAVAVVGAGRTPGR